MVFTADDSEKPFTNGDVISSKEIALARGQKYEMLEPIPPEAGHPAVVARLRAPDRQRSRFVSMPASPPKPASRSAFMAAQ